MTDQKYTGYNTLSFILNQGVLFVTIDSPPINLITLDMRDDFRQLQDEVAADDEVKVIVFKSANPEYFIAHFDVTLLAGFPDTPTPRLEQAAGFALEYKRMPKVTIAQIEGIARGGGCELALALDMRFGVKDKTVFGQPEVAVGILPGGGGTQRLPKLIGRARALELILSGMDINAQTAEQYGLINRALEADEIGPFVEKLAYQIASYPSDVIALNKQAVVSAGDMSLEEGLIEEDYLFGQLASKPEAKRRMQLFMDAGGQTFDGELSMEAILENVKN